MGGVSVEQEEVKTAEKQQNLEEIEWLPIGICTTLDAFRLECAQIFSVSARVLRKKMGHSALLPRINRRNAALFPSLILPNIGLRPP